MSEVQALELRISDNAVETAKALSSLASTLSKLKGTISQGLGLNKVQGDLGKLQTSLRINIPDSTMTRLTALAGTLERIAKAAKEISALKNVPGVGQAMGLGGTATGGSKKTGVTQVAPRTMEVVADATREVGKAAEEANRSVQKFATTITTVAGKGKDGMYGWGGIRSSMTGQALASVADRRRALEQTMAQHVGKGAAEMLGGKNATQEVQQRVQVLQEGVKAADALQTRTNEQAQAQAQVNEQAAGAARQVEQIKATTEQASSSTRNLATNMEESGKKAKLFEFHMRSASGGIMSIVKGLARVARYRFFRYIITTITKSIKEGLENFRGYSKAIKGLYSKDMTALDNSLLKMKNSIGAALAPAIQALIPIFQTVTNWVITAMNYVTQFFALLRGEKTWSRALDVTASDFEKTKDSASGAAKATKELLASWDELNIISQESGGSGSGKTLTDADYKKMFEETGSFSDTVKNVSSFITQNFEKVKELVAWIGAGLAAWMLPGSALGTLGAFVAEGVIVKVEFDIVRMLDNQYYETGEKGWLCADLIVSALGAALGFQAMKGILGEGGATVTAGITLLVSTAASIEAFIENEDLDVLSETNLMSILSTGLKGAAGTALIFHGLSKTDWGKQNLASTATLKGAGGALFATVGLMIGIKAYQRAVEGVGWTTEQIRDTIVSSIAFGGGAALLASAFGAGIAASLAIGGAAAVALAATIVIATTVNAETKPGIIDYGGLHLTEEQITDYVSKNMFTIDATVTINAVKAKVEGFDTATANLRAELLEADIKLDVVKVTANTKDSETELVKQILGENLDGHGGLLGAVNKKIAEMKGVIELNLSLLGSANGEDYSTIFGDFSEMTNWFGRKGTELGEAFRAGASGKIQEISEEIVNATRALEEGQREGELESRRARLEGKYKNMETFDEETVNAIVEEYMTERQALFDSYMEIAQRTVATWMANARFFEATGDLEKAAYYNNLAQQELARISGTGPDSVSGRAEAAAAPGIEWMKNFILEHMSGEFTLPGTGLIKAGSATMNDLLGSQNREEFENRLIDALIDKGVFGNATGLVQALRATGGFNLYEWFSKEQIAEWFGGYSFTRGSWKEKAQSKVLGWYTPKVYDDGPEFSMAEILAESAETVQETTDAVAEVVEAAVEGAAKIEEAAADVPKIPTGSASEMEGFRRFMIGFQGVSAVENETKADYYHGMLDNYGTGWTAFWNFRYGEGFDAIENKTIEHLSFELEDTLTNFGKKLFGDFSMDDPYVAADMAQFVNTLYYLLPSAEAAENLKDAWDILAGRHPNTPDFDSVDAENEGMADDVSRGTAGTEQRLDENNRLMLMMNNILTQILNKPNTFTFSPTPSFGRVVNQSKEMYERSGGMTASP